MKSEKQIREDIELNKAIVKSPGLNSDHRRQIRSRIKALEWVLDKKKPNLVMSPEFVESERLNEELRKQYDKTD